MPRGRPKNSTLKTNGESSSNTKNNESKSSPPSNNNNKLIDPILQAENVMDGLMVSSSTDLTNSKKSKDGEKKKESSQETLDKESSPEVSVPKKRGRPPNVNNKKPAQESKKLRKSETLQNGHHSKPLFSSKALKATFNPLPISDPLFNLLNNDEGGEQSGKDSLHINPRSGNKLNRFTFKRPSWLTQALESSKSSSKPDLNRVNRFLLMFGSGDMGQMGLGVEKLDDVKKPVIHEIVEKLKSSSELSIGPETVACGGMHSLLVDGGGHVWSWGINDNAALGRKTEGIEGVEQEELESRPIRVQNLTDLDSQPFRTVRVEAGDSVSVAVSDKGELRAWGSFRSNDGILGFDGKVGSTVKQLIPTRVGNLSQYPVTQVVCGYDHVLALTADGHVYSWGNGQQQQLGRKIIERRKQNGLTPERLSLKKIVLIGTGGSHSFAVNEDGDVYGWGLNTRGQLGIAQDSKSSEEEIVSTPTLISTMSPSEHDGARVVGIHGGDFHTLFLLNNGQVWSVGSYENGEIGLGKSHPAVKEVEVLRSEGLKEKESFIETSMKKRREKFEVDLKKFEARVKADGDWSKEEIEESRPIWEELTESMEVEQEVASLKLVPGQCVSNPTRVEFPHPIIDISCGARHNLAVDLEGNAYSWGLGQSSELGLGKDEDGDDIEMVEVPNRLKSKALSEAGVNGLGQIKVLKCEAGGTHSVLIGVGSSDKKKPTKNGA